MKVGNRNVWGTILYLHKSYGVLNIICISSCDLSNNAYLQNSLDNYRMCMVLSSGALHSHAHHDLAATQIPFHKTGICSFFSFSSTQWGTVHCLPSSVTLCLRHRQDAETEGSLTVTKRMLEGHINVVKLARSPKTWKVVYQSAQKLHTGAQGIMHALHLCI